MTDLAGAWSRALAFCLAASFLSGCIAPVSQREAQQLAADGLKRFCRQQPCGVTHMVATQKIKKRWLVDFDASGGRYTVIVEANGNTQVNVWDKNQLR